jgi:rod shape determining protein RodA
MLLLSGIGLTILYALSPDLFYHQLWTVLAGIVAFSVVRHVDQETYKQLWWLWYILAVVLLVVTFSAPLVRGSHRWIELFGQSIQPSEVMKPFIIISLAGFLSTRTNFRLREYSIYTGMFLVPFFLILKQPDLGNSIVYLFVYLSLLFVSNFPLRYYMVPLIMLAIFSPIVWPFLEDYQKLRVITFINPSYDIQGAGYNAYQSLIAVGSGGLFGKGLGSGTQSSLSFLPEFHTDFIFASAVEQIGLIGGMVILVLFSALIITMLHPLKEGNIFVRMVVWGFFAQFTLQTLVNIGMNVGIVPITGITLPFISFGGSSIIATFVSFGILSSFHSDKKNVIAIR